MVTDVQPRSPSGRRLPECILLSLLLMLCPFQNTPWAQQWTTYTTGTTGGKLSSNLINSISQDPDGGMWFTSERIFEESSHHLDRFDGAWQRYDHDAAGGVFADRDGRMWVGGQNFLGHYEKQGNTWQLARTYDKGLARGAYRFTGFDLQGSRNEFTLEGFEVASVFQDRDGLMWFGTAHGVSRYDGEKDEWNVFRPETGVLDSVEVLTIAQDVDGAMWFGSVNGLVRFDRENGTWETFERFAETPVTSVIRSDDGAMWIGAGFGPEAGVGLGLSRYELRNGWGGQSLHRGIRERSSPEGRCVRHHQHRSGKRLFRQVLRRFLRRWRAGHRRPSGLSCRPVRRWFRQPLHCGLRQQPGSKSGRREGCHHDRSRKRANRFWRRRFFRRWGPGWAERWMQRRNRSL